MSEVIQYTLNRNDAVMEEHPNGAWIKHKDLKAALSQLAALREELAEIKSSQESLRKSLRKARHRRDDVIDERDDRQQRLADAERRNAELERDAARYRYLRDPDNRDDLEPEDVIVVGIAEGEDIVWLEQMDRAIDVMMESLNPKPEAASHDE